MNEIKEILEKVGGFSEANFDNNIDDRGNRLVKVLETYINSHYIAKEKVKGLKKGEYHPKAKDRDYDRGYNDCVLEINKIIDGLVGDNK